MKPSPPDFQNLYLRSLDAIGIDSQLHDIRFVEDDWESPTLGAAGFLVGFLVGFLGFGTPGTLVPTGT